MTRVGDDALGREVRERFRLLGLPTETVQIDPEFPTGTVDVALAQGGQPRFTIREHVAWDRIMADENSLPRPPVRMPSALAASPSGASRHGPRSARSSRPPAPGPCVSST